MSRTLAGDRRVWLVAGAILGACLIGILIKLATPEDRYTGTNSVGVRSVVAQVKPGQRLCVPQLRVPPDTGRVRVAAFWEGNRRPGFRVELKGGGLRRAGRTPPNVAASPVSGARVDIPVRRTGPRADDIDRTLCVTPEGRPAAFGGMIGLQGDQRSPTVSGKPIESRVAVWFLPPAGESRSALGLLPDAFARAALFRPGFVGPWTYLLLLLVVVPAAALFGVRLLATRVAGTTGAAGAGLAIAAVAFTVAGTWALLTPAFDAPDEPEHFTYAQTLAESGKAPDKAPGPRPGYSSTGAAAFDGVRIYSHVELVDARPPWLQADEDRWRARVRAGPPSPDDGGGYLVSSSTHAPPYYALTFPSYELAGSDNPYSQLTLMRLVSALLAALVAACGFLTVRELLPQQQWAAVAAGLLIAFQPMFTFIGGAVNNDNGVNALAAVLVFLLIRGLRRGLSWPLGLALGVTLVLLPLMKGTGYALYPAAAVGIVGMVWRRHGRADLPGYAALAGALVACQLLWVSVADSFGRSTFTTPGGGAPTGAGGPVGRVLEFPATYLSYLWQVFLPRLPFMNDLLLQRWPAYDIYVERGWAAFGWYALKFPMWVYVVIAATLIVVGLLALVVVWRERIAALGRAWELAVLVLTIAGVIGGVEAAYFSAQPRPVIPEQGRYAFTAIVPLAAIAIGGCFAFGRSRAPVLAAGLISAVMGLCLASMALALTGFYL